MLVPYIYHEYLPSSLEALGGFDSGRLVLRLYIGLIHCVETYVTDACVDIRLTVSNSVFADNSESCMTTYAMFLLQDVALSFSRRSPEPHYFPNVALSASIRRLDRTIPKPIHLAYRQRKGRGRGPCWDHQAVYALRKVCDPIRGFL